MSNKQVKRYYEFVTPEGFHDKPTKDISSRAVWEGFQAQTTAHGIPHVKNARGPIKTSFWVFASIVCCGMLIYYAYFLFDKFFSYPVTVRVQVKNKPEMIFPAVTLCNHNMIRKSQIEEFGHPELLGLFGYTSRRPNRSGSRSRRQLFPNPPLVNPQLVDDMTDIPSDTDATTEDPSATTPSAGFRSGNGTSSGGRPVRASFERLQRLQEIIAGLRPSDRRQLGYQREQFILDCEYSGAFCYASDFATEIYSPVYGNCFTFNVDGLNTTNVQKSHRPGPTYGLALTINIDQDNYHTDLSKEAGVRIVVHDQDRMPFPEDEGISVMPGQMTFVGARMVSISRLGRPYGKCTHKTDRDYTRNAYAEIHGVGYSPSACFKTCFQQNLIKRCDCASAVMPRDGRAFPRTRNICSVRNDRQMRCYNKVQNDYQNERLDCDCPTVCTESTFSLTTSSAAWPSSTYKRTLINELVAEHPYLHDVLRDRDNPDKYKDNLVRIVIYFEEFNYEDITEYASYESFAFVSDIGGILGLFVGFSVMTISEFLELGLDLLVLNVINKCPCCPCRKRKRRDRVQSAPVMDRNHVTLEPIDGGVDESAVGAMTPPPPYQKQAFVNKW